MEKELIGAIKEYIENHPEFDEIMKIFQMSMSFYWRALDFNRIQNELLSPANTLTTDGKYKINVSEPN